MPLNIRDEEVNRLATKLAQIRGVSKTDAVRHALVNELRRPPSDLPLRERLKPIQDRVQAREPTGEVADKAFYDSLYDE